ncbi:hypothetical protein [Persicitalea jodogahamensis]|uniref:Uncharacterized protein n=1 Tax=Persicitalea jodogahamensis TaxID=402147 RepID=A0A8J3D464_9BACT|nr:hypothetical protein [Persicitalea jodogahamensis]GHB72226.1 hypothetical protein GCM10007390_27850 [Persicitalea jodogahamensis]
MKKPALLAFTLLVLVACGGNQASSTESPAETTATALIFEDSQQSPFKFTGKAPCDFLDTQTVAAGLGVSESSITVKPDRDKDDHKVCRYEIKDGPGAMSVLTVSINFNKNKEKTPKKLSNRLNEALTNGLPMMGYKDQVQAFKEIKGLGTQTAYSGNMPNDKNLLTRLDDDYLISLQYNKYLPGQDIGDFEQKLKALMVKILE